MSKPPSSKEFTGRRERNTPFRSYPESNAGYRQHHEINNYSTPNESPDSNSHNAILFGVIILVLAVAFWAIFLNHGTTSGTRTVTTPSPTTNIAAKNIGHGSYVEYLQEGQTITYYFDVKQVDSNKKVIKVVAQTQAGNTILSAVGINYVPSIENQKYDYISAPSYPTYAVIDIYNPKTGRYFVTLKGIKGSGDTRIYQASF